MSFNVSLNIGEYLITSYSHGTFWISNQYGEGMEISEIKLEEYFKKIFEEEF